MVQYAGVGKHVQAITYPQLIIYLKLEFAYQFLYAPSSVFPKLSVLALYYRIFCTRPYRFWILLTGTLMILWCLALIAFDFGACTPIAYNWDKHIAGGYCADLNASYKWASVPNIITDGMMLVLPLPAVWRLGLTARQKWGLTVTFMTASA